MLKKYISENPPLKDLKVPLCLIGTDYRIVDHNIEFSRVFKLNCSQNNSLSFRQLLSASSQEKFLESINAVLLNSTIEEFGAALIYNKKNYMIGITPQLISDGNEKYILLTIKDNSEVSGLKNALHGSEEKYKQLIKNSPVGMLILIKGKIHLANYTLAKTLGYENEKHLVGKDITEFVAPEFLNTARNRLKKLSNGSGNVVETNEEQFIRKDGTLVDVLVAGHSIEYNNEPAIQGYIFDITASKRMESDLRLSEEKFKKAFYTSPDAITISRLSDGKFIDSNEGYTKIVGYSREETIGRLSQEINIWDDPRDREKLVTNISETGFVSNLEAKFRMKTGELVYGLMSASIIVLDGEPCILAITRDITNIKKTQLKLKESEERFRSMFENANAIMILIDPDNGKIVDANQAACKFYGYNYDTIVNGLYLSEINVSHEESQLYNLRQSVVSGNKFFKFKHKLANGEIRDVEVYSGKVHIGDKIRLYSIIHDVTDRRLAEEENIKLTQAIKQSPASIVITDTKGNIEFVNEKVESVTGYNKAELVGRNPSIFKSGHTSEKEYKDMWNSIINGKTWRGEFLNKSKDGKYFWELASISPIKNTEGKLTHFLAVKEDITSDKEKEKKLIEAKEKAELSDKLKSEFLAQMSHEIRTPINVILSFTSLLQSEFINNVDEDTQTIFNSIESSGQRIIRTIDLIINMSELQSGSYETDPKNTDVVSKIIDPLILEYKVLAQKKGLELEFNPATNNISLFVDEYSTSQIFSNLIDNAIKYTQEGKVEVHLFADEHSVITVEVRDTGIGISEKYLPELFKPFSQEEQGYTRRYEGNGLGLAIVKKYCELNNAEIRVKSKKGEGTVFTVKFYENQEKLEKEVI